MLHGGGVRAASVRAASVHAACVVRAGRTVVGDVSLGLAVADESDLLRSRPVERARAHRVQPARSAGDAKRKASEPHAKRNVTVGGLLAFEKKNGKKKKRIF